MQIIDRKAPARQLTDKASGRPGACVVTHSAGRAAAAGMPTGEMITEVSIAGLRVMAQIGVYEDEQGRRQVLIIDASLVIEELSADSIAHTFNYRDFEIFASALGGERIALIETFARLLAIKCLESPLVRSADISVAKPGALENGLAKARVVISRYGTL